MANPALPVLCLVTCLCLPTFVLLCIGCFTPYWVVIDNTNEISGLFYSCGRNTSGCVVDLPDEILNKGTLGLEVTAICLLVLAFVILIWNLSCRERETKWNDDDDFEDNSSVLGIVCFIFIFACLYAIAGVCILVGCILIAVDYNTSNLGYSFYLCIAAGCYDMFKICIILCFLCKSACKNHDIPNPVPKTGIVISVTETSGSQTNTEPQRPPNTRRDSALSVAQEALVPTINKLMQLGRT